MVMIRKFVFSICNFFVLRGPRRIKASSACPVVRDNDTSLESVGSDGASKNSQVGAKPDEGIDSKLCCVCLSGVKERDENRSTLPCMHEFHRVCIESWFNGRRRTCPVCRFCLEEEEENIRKGEELTEEMAIWFSSFHVAGF